MSSVEEMVDKMTNCISRIDRNREDYTSFERLYDLALETVDYLSDLDKGFEPFFPIRSTKGTLDKKYRVDISSCLGFKSVFVVDVRRVEKNPVVRTYKIRKMFKDKEYSMYEIDIRNGKMLPIHMM